MRTIKTIFVALLFSLLLSSCYVFEKGYTNDNGQYVPKNPNFKLKDKPNNIIPNNLDTEDIYRLAKIYDSGKLIYPKKNLTTVEQNSFLQELQMSVRYLKFYQNGRCLNFSISSKNRLNTNNQLKETDLNHNNPYYSKEYYYSNDGKEIYKESFVYGEGFGMYSITSFVLNKAGDSIIIDDKKGSKVIYTKEILPINWKKYNVDW